MGDVIVRVLGSGDSVGSGGRFQTCFMATAPPFRFLIDCGASSLIPMKRDAIDTASIDAILLSHLHGDHFGGIPFFMIDARYVARRRRPLTVAGPPGLERRVRAAAEAFFPGAWDAALGFEVRFVEIPERQPIAIGPIEVTAYPAEHPSGAPSYSLRVACDGRVIAYSGDTEWTDALVEVARDADLFLCESYMYDKPVKGHLTYRQLLERRSDLRCHRLLLTHLSDEVLARLATLELEVATDGLEVRL